MDAEEEAMLAQLIAQDMQQLKDRSAGAGVLAYARKPVPRERPNERFLQNTLRNLGQANRRADEQSMWASRQRQLDLDEPDTSRRRKRQRSASPSPERAWSPRSRSATSSERASPLNQASDLSEEELAGLLASKGVRGRGGVGSRAEETGPYLAGEMADEPRVLGPARPAWLQSDKDATDVAESALQAARWLHWQQQQHQQQQEQGKGQARPAKHKKSKKHKKAKKKHSKDGKPKKIENPQ